MGFLSDSLQLTKEQKSRVDHVANMVLSKRRPPTQIPAKLSISEKEGLEKLSKSAHVVIASPDDVDQRFSKIHADAPWLSLVTEGLWLDARDRSQRGMAFGFWPTVIVGPPGGGKSKLARSIAEAFSVPSVDVDAGATGGIFELQGTAHNWANGAPGRITSCIVSSRISNPVVIVDELDAGGIKTSTNRGALPGLFRVLLGLLEPVTARSWTCPYYGMKFDLSHVSFICTSNSLNGLPPALLSRLRVISVGDVSMPDLTAFMRRKAAACGLDEMGTDAAIRIITEMQNRNRRVDLRTASRAIEIALSFQNRPTLN